MTEYGDVVFLTDCVSAFGVSHGCMCACDRPPLWHTSSDAVAVAAYHGRTEVIAILKRAGCKVSPLATLVRCTSGPRRRSNCVGSVPNIGVSGPAWRAVGGGVRQPRRHRQARAVTVRAGRCVGDLSARRYHHAALGRVARYDPHD